jgi:hypothetical protein
MSLELITKDDFVGFLNIDFSDISDDFTVWADQLEQKVLPELMGDAMYQDMLSDPTNPDYVYLVDNFLQDMQKGLFYYYYIKDRISYSSTTGQMRARAENAEQDKANRNTKMVRAWNDGIKHYQQAYEYITSNPDKYPLYDSTQPKGYMNVFGIHQAPTRIGSYPVDHDDWFIRGAR